MARMISIWFAQRLQADMLLWLRRYTPYVRRLGGHEAGLDIAGWSPAFGGDVELMADIGRRLDAAGVMHSLASAGTMSAARILARSGHGLASAPSTAEELAATLSRLPLSALDLDLETLRAMDEAGLRTLRGLMAIDRDALPHLLGGRSRAETTLALLDQALGRRPEPFTPDEPPPRYISRLSISGRSSSLSVLAAGLDRLLADIADQMRAEARGARRLVLQVFGAAGDAREVSVTSANVVQTASDLRSLFVGQLAAALPDGGFDALAVEAHRCGPMERRSETPAERRHARQDFSTLNDLVHTIMPRIDAARTPVLKAQLRPERSRLN